MIEKSELEELIESWYSIRKIAEHFDCSQSTVRHWLKRYKLKTKRGPKGSTPLGENVPRKCKCGETDPEKFYGNKRSVCAKCHNAYTLYLRRKIRSKALEYYGGKCKLCGYDKFECALDFHHPDPENKDINFVSAWSWSWSRLKKELDKCVLLCKNCHSAVHTGILKL